MAEDSLTQDVTTQGGTSQGGTTQGGTTQGGTTQDGTSRVTTTLWFDGRVEEAAELCTSLFPGSRVVRTPR